MVSPPRDASQADQAPVQYTLGSLSYNRRQLCLLFFWLLLGDVVFVLMNEMEPKMLPLILKSHQATDKEIAFIVGTIVALMNFFITPIVSYRSDRKRSRWGRRIPYLLWATPFVAVFLAVTAFVPEITQALLRWPWSRTILEWAPVSSPVVAVYALLIFVYEIFHMVVASIFFYLFRDVVPTCVLGRFLALFRVFGALGSFMVNYWLLGLSLTHTREIFLGVAVIYCLGFVGMCLFVKEGEYPPVESSASHPASGQPGARRFGALRTFFRESFREPIYWWIYLAAAMIGALYVLQAFVVFFPQLELGLSLDEIGKMNAWASLAWIPLALPVGWALDRWGPIRVLSLCLVVQCAVAGTSFLFVAGKQSYLIAAIGASAFFPFGLTMLSLTMLFQRLYASERFGQLSAAASIVRTLIVASMISPFIGWLLSSLQNIPGGLTLPWHEGVKIGPYRFVYLLQLGLLLIALVAVRMTRREWLKLGGPERYQAPL